MKLVRGRSKQSHLVLASRNVHCFVWAPWAHGSESTGLTLRWRHNGGWTHHRLVVWQRNPVNGREWARKATDRVERGKVGTMAVRPTVTVFELCRWRTEPGTYDRIGVKAYLRLKMSAGGNETRDG